MTQNKKSAFKTYISEIKEHFHSGQATEHTYRPALETFIRSFGTSFKVTNEPGQKGKGSKNKPDFVVMKGKAPLGYIETKDVGIDLDEVANSNQIHRYCEAYPNLIVTDYVEFRRYVKGELRSRVRIAKTSKTGFTLIDSNGEEISKFFSEFLLEEAFSVSSSIELADRLASLTRQIRKLVKNELEIEEDSDRLHKLMLAFKKVLIADLDADKFADMFAQTLAYGFFAARVHFDGKGEFSRRTASSLLPKTNPFLKKLFREFADDNLPESLTGAVDDIIELLRKTDIQKILIEFGSQGKNDAVIHFYESFLGAFDPKLKKEMGVFYTPDAVVDYMVKSLDEILVTKFGRKHGLADDKTLLLDPALGTGSYLHKIVEKIHSKVQKGAWDSYVADNLLDRIFGFEILMAPYAVAHLNLGLQLQKTGYTFDKDQRLGVFLTNTLEETAKRSEVLFADWISEEANSAAAIKRDKAIMVVTGNPPYSKESQNDGKWIRDLMRGYDGLNSKKCANYFECEGKPLGERNPKWLNDDYVKFIRFAHWRIEQTGFGVLGFITNHGYLNNPTFRGMREALMKDFHEIYILDLHGNVKKKESAPDGSKDENVFDITTGVSICFMIRSEGVASRKDRECKVYRADLYGVQEKKFEWLLDNTFSSTDFKQVKPESPAYLFTHQNHRLRKEFELGKKINEVFPKNSVGVVTARDSLTIHDTPEQIWKVVRDLASQTSSDAREKYNLGKDSTDWKVDWAIKDLKSSGPTKDRIIPILYRPFDIRHTYYTGKSSGFMCRARDEVMNHMLTKGNIGICFTRPTAPSYEFSVLVSDGLIDQCAVGNKSAGAGISYLAPMWLSEGKQKSVNLDPETSLTVASLGTAEEFFYYVYATLSSTEYKNKYAEFLKADFPRVQITADRKLFKKLAELGEELAHIHLLRDDRLAGGKVTFANKGTNVIEFVRYDAKASKIFINDHQYFGNVTSHQWEHQVGGYNILEKWLKDRKDKTISHREIDTFEKIAEVIEVGRKTISKIDGVIENAGGWPLADAKEPKKRAA